MGKSEDQNPISRTMGLRMDQDTYNKLERLSQEMQIKKSTLLKKALKGWAIIRTSLNTENMVIIGKPMLIFLMKTLNEEKSIELANFVSDNVCSIIANRILEDQKELSTEYFLKFIVDGMGMDGKGWFNKIQVQKITEHKYRLFGTHQFGKNFSTFFFHLITNIVENFEQYKTKKNLKIKNENMVSILISKKSA